MSRNLAVPAEYSGRLALFEFERRPVGFERAALIMAAGRDNILDDKVGPIVFILAYVDGLD